MGSLYFGTYSGVDAKKKLKIILKVVLIIKCRAFQDETQDLFQWRIPLRPALRCGRDNELPGDGLVELPGDGLGRGSSPADTW